MIIKNNVPNNTTRHYTDVEVGDIFRLYGEDMLYFETEEGTYTIPEGTREVFEDNYPVEILDCELSINRIIR